jgi:general secretion pathway protein D
VRTKIVAKSGARRKLLGGIAVVMAALGAALLWPDAPPGPQPGRWSALEGLGPANPFLKGSSAPAALESRGAESQRARFRWHGPAQVRSGEPFAVALKVTAAQPLLAAPLQLSFDASRVEPVSVRAGAFFADGTSSYRVSPEGSIYFGASGRGAPAADAELVVAVLRPLRAGATEVRLSSVMLRDVAGRVIEYDAPATFRALVVD